MLMLHPILLIFSFVLLLLAAFGIGLPRVQLGWLGLSLFVFSFILR